MPSFLYRAKTKQGETRQGRVEASNVSTATQTLQNNGLIVIDLQLERSLAFYARNLALFDRVSSKDIAVFSRQFASLISAGVPMTSSLSILTSQIRNKRLRAAMADISSSVSSGTSLSAAMSEYSKIFSQFYIQLVKAGEVSGNLDKSMLFLADHTERSYKTYHKVKSALTYPIFVIILFIAIFLGMFLFIVPNFVGILTEQGADIPFLTQVMITISDLVKGYWFVPLIALGVGLRFVFTPQGRMLWDRVQLRIPVLGRIFIYSNIFRFAESFFILVRGGVPLVEALGITEKIVTNHIYQDIIKDVKEGVTRGKSIAPIFAIHPEVPSMVSQMIAIGERTGKVDGMTEHLAKFYEEELNDLIDTATSLIQPVLIVFLGLGVFLFLLGVLLPIYNTLGSGAGV